MDENKDYLILLKEGKYYFPVYRIIKKSSDKYSTKRKNKEEVGENDG